MKPFANHSGIAPEPFQTSRARADQGSGNKGAWSGDLWDVVPIHRHSVKASRADAWMAADAAIGGGW